MNRAPVPIPREAWIYVTTYAGSAVFGIVAFAWGVWLTMPFVHASAANVVVLVRDGKTSIGVMMAMAGLLQFFCRGLIARGFWLPPVLVAVLWSVWTILLINGSWYTPGPVIYGMLALLHFGIAALANHQWLTEAASVARETIEELRRG